MLKNVFLVAGLMLAQLLVGAGVVDGQTTTTASTTTAPADADKIDKEIRASADAFVAAFQKRDAAAIAAASRF
jgi:hypothetical protein